VPGPLLETKLHVPRRRRGMVGRPRLAEQLNRSAHAALTLVSAPAGFGKTTVLSEWLADAPADAPRAAWLSLDERDNDPTLFWTYVVAALQTAAGDVGATALSILESTGAATEAVLATLVNDLDALSHEVLLVLDDFHLIEDRTIRESVEFLVEHLPPQLHLVIASRADPTLPLPRLRARGQLVELRAADLRFTAEESAAYLTGEMGLDLTDHDVAALDGRTEGWIAALQLAALSMQGREDVAEFIAGFAGDDRYIVDYLAEEVLQRQPEEVRRFLLQTSILERLSGPLCDAVTGRSDGKAMLQTLERANLFLRPLDDRRQWFRYHQLFADVLQTHLLDEQPDDIPALHHFASRWHEEHGDTDAAFRHAIAAHDFNRAADLAELVLLPMHRDRREVEIRNWICQIPEAILRTRPVLNLSYVGALMSVNEFEGIAERIRTVEQSLDAPPDARVVVDEDRFRTLPGMVQLYKSALALSGGDLDRALAHARRATDEAAEDDYMCRGGASAVIGLIHWTRGELEAAQEAYTQGMADLGRMGWVSDVVGGTITLSDIRMDQGRLSDALATCEQTLRTIPEGNPPLRGLADVYIAMSDVHYERNELDVVRALLERVENLGEHVGLPKAPFRRRVAMARLRAAEGDREDALRLLDEAERVYQADFAPNVRPIAAVRTRVWLAQGRLTDAQRWAREQGLTPEDDLSYVREYEHITLAQLWLAQHEQERDNGGIGAATRLLERLLVAAQEGERTGRVVEILALQALALQAQGERTHALAALQRAVTLAEPEGHARVLIDLGPPIASLLRTLAKQPASPYLRRLIAALSTTEPAQPQGQPLVDPLSERELDVLRLLASELDGPAIARHLVVSLNTVRTHTKNIYAKLGVNSRRAAVRRAEELDLLAR
jgi:LuxR family maltose regulon positive regulatory protein